jgi:hypothetical protein
MNWIGPRPDHEHFVSLDTGQPLAQHLQYDHGFPRNAGGQSEQLDRIHTSVKVPQAWWDVLIADPVSTLAPQQQTPQPPQPCNLAGRSRREGQHGRSLRVHSLASARPGPPPAQPAWLSVVNHATRSVNA